jgi:hypothetical protein
VRLVDQPGKVLRKLGRADFWHDHSSGAQLHNVWDTAHIRSNDRYTHAQKFKERNTGQFGTGQHAADINIP